MTNFIKLINSQPNGNPIAEENFRQLFPNTSFPRFFTAEDVEPLGYGIYDFKNQPTLDRYKKAVETVPVRSVFGIWMQTWQIVEMTDAEKLEADDFQSRQTRAKRNFLLSECDWIVIMHTEKGTNVPSAWEAYRQSLRDITNHVNFPYLTDADWPVKPE